MSAYSYPKAIDDLIMLLACRYDANPNFGEEEDSTNAAGDIRATYSSQQERSWSLVAEGVRIHLRHPLTDDERAYLRFVDVDLFTAEMCRNRAQYALWREQQRLDKAAKGPAARPSSEKKHAVSGFSVTKHSIHDEVARLYAQVRSSLPSCDDVDLSDTDDDEEKTALINSSIGATAARNTRQQSTNPFDKLKQFSLKSQADVDRDIALAKAEEDLIAQFAVLQQEHFKKTRRWVDVPQEMTQSPTTPAQSISVAEMNLKAFEKTVGVIRPQNSASAANTNTPTGVSKSQRAPNATQSHKDPIQIAKSALNPFGRPPRPSEEYEDEEEGAEDFLASNDVADVLSAWKKPTEAASSKLTNEISPPKRVEGTKNIPQPTTATSASSSRGAGRWNIVEYSDNDEEDEDA